jgi:hypothetical protein
MGRGTPPGLVGSIRLMVAPFKCAEFVAHDSRLQFGSLNDDEGGTLNPQRPVTELPVL